MVGRKQFLTISENMKRMKFHKKDFSDAIRAKLKYEDNLRSLGEKIGVSASTLSRVLNHKLPDVMSYAKICKYFDFNMEDYIK